VVRELLEERRGDLVTKAIDLALAGDVGALRLCIERLAPPLKSISDAVVIAGLADAKTLTEKSEAIVHALGKGAVSPTVAGELLTAVGSLAKAMEVDELTRRVSNLERLTPDAREARGAVRTDHENSPSATSLEEAPASLQSTPTNT
jgi:ERCC4-type nuclease